MTPKLLAATQSIYLQLAQKQLLESQELAERREQVKQLKEELRELLEESLAPSKEPLAPSSDLEQALAMIAFKEKEIQEIN